MGKRTYFIYIFLFILIPFTSSRAQENLLTDSQKNSVDLVWQGNTYTPPFYKGRALWPSQGEVIFTALVNGTSQNPKNLYYKWVKNGTVLGNLSGIGKNSYIYNDAGLFIPQRIRVDVLSGETLVGRASIDIHPSTPQVFVYENSPLIGYVFEREVSNIIQLNKEEISLSAFPYFFSTNSRDDGSISYVWSINNSSSNQSGSKITLRTPGTEGKSLILISLKNSQKVSQGARKDFLVQFSNENQL